MSSLQPLESIQLGERTFDSIRQAIISGELPAGEPVHDRVLAAALGVSRTPVREALQRLEHTGLVESRGRAGWIVASFTEQDIHELFDLRRALEPLGIDELERNPDPAILAELGAFFDGFAHTIPTDRYKEYLARDNEFHKRIVSCGGNGRLQHLYSVIEHHIDRGRYFISVGIAGRVESNLDEHVAVALALGAGDFPAARTALIHHLDQGEQLMVEHLRLSRGAQSHLGLRA